MCIIILKKKFNKIIAHIISLQPIMVLYALIVLINMVQNRKKIDKKISNTSSVNMKDAVRMIIKKGQNIFAVGKYSKISFSSLCRYMEKAKPYGLDEVKYTPNYKCRQVFTNEAKILSKNYAVKAYWIHYGFTLTQLKKLAHYFADHNSRKIVPQLWTKNLTAGENWLDGFMNRFKDLSLRRPEATSLSREFLKNSIILFN